MVRYTQLQVFLCTFILYALVHAERKTFSNMKSILHNEWLMSSTFMGVCDSIFMLCYAISLSTSGRLIDQYNTVYILTCGLMTSAICMILFSISHIYNYHNNQFIIYCIMGLHGTVQSVIYPSCIVLISRYFQSNQGTIYGIWSCNNCLGNILGTVCIAYLIQWNLSIQLIFTIPAITLIIAGMITVAVIQQYPPDTVSYKILLHPAHTIDIINSDMPTSTDSPSLSILSALQIPGVLQYGLAHAFIKYTNYCCFFWLPYYLCSVLGYTASYSDIISTLYDIGSICGSISIGLISDKLQYKSPVMCMYAALSCIAILMYNTIHTIDHDDNNSILYISIVMFMSGMLIGGPAGLIPSACTTDLCNTSELRNSTGTIVGIIDSIGSIGSACGPIVVAYIIQYYTWNYVFYLMCISMICSIVCMYRMIKCDVLQIVHNTYTVKQPPSPITPQHGTALTLAELQ